MEAERAGGMAHLANRLHEDGALLAGISVAEAADVLWVLCSFESFDLLYTGRGLALEDTIERIVTTAERALCRPRRRRR
jgi:hypothetical protein